MCVKKTINLKGNLIKGLLKIANSIALVKNSADTGFIQKVFIFA